VTSRQQFQDEFSYVEPEKSGTGLDLPGHKNKIEGSGKQEV